MAATAPGAEEAGDQSEFFESRIRPILVERCYECHNSVDNAEGELAVDHRSALRKGGTGGSIIIPGKPEQSRLIGILRHEFQGLEMPLEGPKLDEQVVADFEAWIKNGAFDPRDKAPSAEEFAATTSWNAVLQRRKAWWSFQPIRKSPPPAVVDETWNEHPIDRFIRKKLTNHGLEPTDHADPKTLVRRIYFSLIGLPPNSQDVVHWSNRIAAASQSQRQQAIEDLVDRLLGSPRYGERWARHWMDWIRYAESHGSEGDPEIVQAWAYRDYLIRAFNADIPFNQLVVEHVAGDLMPNPRINSGLEINESAIGPAHWRMVFHGFAPTDALDEKVRFIDDQINAFSKAFLGLTVSCARCHDHKFDAISQEDYYALFGILASCRPGRTVIDLPHKLERNHAELTRLKSRIRDALANDWLHSIARIAERMSTDDTLSEKAENPGTILFPWLTVKKKVADGDDFQAAWAAQRNEFDDRKIEWAKHQSKKHIRRWNLANDTDYKTWFATGLGLPDSPQTAGEFAIATSGENALVGIYPAGVYSHRITAKHAARLTSEDFSIGKHRELWLRVIGAEQASSRYVVQDYPRNGTVYPVTNLRSEWHWQKYNLSYWEGDEIHIELATASDAPLLAKSKDRSWFGVREVVLVDKGEKIPSMPEHLQPIFDQAADSPPRTFEDLTSIYTNAISKAIQAWKENSASDEQALLLDACLRQGLISNRHDELVTAHELISKYRKLESEIAVPTRVPGLEETVATNHPLFTRGNHKLPAEKVPRRFLEAIDSTAYNTNQSGRLELANDLIRDDNPLTRRVIVNRIWHHLFGRGIVSTPDNFGRLGDKPSHPELLDWLANRFEEDGWSIRRLIRLIVTSRAWQLSSTASPQAKEIDPENRLISHANVRRLEAEAIRDHLLTVAGRIEHRLFGAPVAGDSMRRSVYMRVRRNSLDPFLRAFDFPEPFSTVGRRDVTNVPAQSLTMLNDPKVSGYAESWSDRVLSNSSLKTESERIDAMFLTGFGRPATAVDIDRVMQYLEMTRDEQAKRIQQWNALNRQLGERQKQIDELKLPVIRRLKEKPSNSTNEESLPKAIASWEFDESVSDRVGTLDGQLNNGAHVQDGALVLDGQGFVVTEPLKQAIKEKTLEVWVQLGNLGQRGGGVMTLQTPDGVIFDSIVFGEANPRQWLAGSNHFKRTMPFEGPQETDAVKQPVHIAIAYHTDGQIIGYRNGRQYGKSYKSDGPYEFKAGNAIVSFGVRHLPASAGRLLSGRLIKAQLYDRALSADEIAASAGTSNDFLPEDRILVELTASQREEFVRLKMELGHLQSRVRNFGPPPKSTDERMLWTELARAMFTFKEFIYVR